MKMGDIEQMVDRLRTSAAMGSEDVPEELFALVSHALKTQMQMLTALEIVCTMLQSINGKMTTLEQRIPPAVVHPPS